MADYLCKRCWTNNNGWCVKRKKNKLSEVTECEEFYEGTYAEYINSGGVKKVKSPSSFMDAKLKRIDVFLIKHEESAKDVMVQLIKQGYAVMKSSQEVNGEGHMHRLDVFKREG